MIKQLEELRRDKIRFYSLRKQAKLALENNNYNLAYIIWDEAKIYQENIRFIIRSFKKTSLG